MSSKFRSDHLKLRYDKLETDVDAELTEFYATRAADITRPKPCARTISR